MQCPRSISPARCASPPRLCVTQATRLASTTAEQGVMGPQLTSHTNASPAASDHHQRHAFLGSQPQTIYWEEELQRLRDFHARPSRFLREAKMQQTITAGSAGFHGGFHSGAGVSHNATLVR